MKKSLKWIMVALCGILCCSSCKKESESKKMENMIRFSSTFAVSKDNDLFTYQMRVPYTDEYQIDFDSSLVDYYEIKDENDNVLYHSNKSFKANLTKHQVVFVDIQAKGANKDITTKVKATNHLAVLPYDNQFSFDASTADVYGDSTIDPLKPAVINYVKREGGTYINCNNPELLTDYDLNKALCRNNLTGDVFFTFEHNNGISKPFYYGYQVKNNNDHDIYVTVQNLGFQLDGPGCWLGEDEWIQFYNTKFHFDTSTWNQSQWDTFNSLYGFSGKYEPAMNQPITYTLPAGKHMYVMGGTTSDAYRNINVFNSADKPIKGGCSNAAVLFSIHGGEAEGAFYIYDNPIHVQNNTTHQGYITHKPGHYKEDGVTFVNFGSQYVGYDTCHGVVDNEATWYFNDLTPSRNLPVNYKTYYSENAPVPGTPYSKIPNIKEHEITYAYQWVTHINPQSAPNGVGTDMTRYITKNEDGNIITIDREYYDGRGQFANIGNWMIDYQDNFSFVNQGDRERQIVLTLVDNGSCAVMIRDKDGNVLSSTYTLTRVNNKSFDCTITVPAHSVLQLTLEYNLLANSSGYLVHRVILK